MKPTDETIEKFQEIYFREFGERISKEEAYSRFLRLVNFLRIVMTPPDNEEAESAQDTLEDSPEFDE